MIKKILFPTDGSECSKNAERYVIDFAQKFKSEVILLHTYEIPEVGYGHPSTVGIYHYNDKMIEDITTAAKNFTDEVKVLFEAENIPVKTILKKGNAGAEIIQALDSEDCDLVIMGSRGLGGIKSFLLGSTSNYVVHHTKKPVMLIH